MRLVLIIRMSLEILPDLRNTHRLFGFFLFEAYHRTIQWECSYHQLTVGILSNP